MKLTTNKLLLLVFAVAAAGALVYAFRPQPVEVDLAPVTRGSLTVTIDEDGQTRIKERYTVSSPLAGRLQRITLEAGDPVVAGQTVVGVIEPNNPHLLDPREQAEAEARVKAATAAVRQTTANVERARSDAALAKRDLERARALFADQVVSQQEFETLESREHAAEEDLKAAEFAQQIASFEREQAEAARQRVFPAAAGAEPSTRLVIPSPINGRVLRVFQESAVVVTAGTPLVELGDPLDLEIVVDLLSTDAVRVSPGAIMILEHWGGGDPLLARVRLVEPAAFLKLSALGVEEQRVNVIGDFVDPVEKRAGLGDAYRVEARIVTWQGDDVLRIPIGALFRRAGQWAVFVADGSRAALRQLELGHLNEEHAEVRDGLAETDRVILHPGDRVRDGVRIRERPR